MVNICTIVLLKFYVIVLTFHKKYTIILCNGYQFIDTIMRFI